MNNQERAAYGEKAVPVGNPDHADSMTDPELGINTSASDTIANILHYVDSLGGDTAKVLRLASMHYSAEVLGEAQAADDAADDGFSPWLATDYESSQVKQTRYNEQEQKMQIRFRNGVVYQYQNVPASLHVRLRKDASPGSFLHKVIKARADEYPATRL